MCRVRYRCESSAEPVLGVDPQEGRSHGSDGRLSSCQAVDHVKLVVVDETGEELVEKLISEVEGFSSLSNGSAQAPQTELVRRRTLPVLLNRNAGIHAWCFLFLTRPLSMQASKTRDLQVVQEN